jgi:hypothetical protein
MPVTPSSLIYEMEFDRCSSRSPFFFLIPCFSASVVPLSGGKCDYLISIRQESSKKKYCSSNRPIPLVQEVRIRRPFLIYDIDILSFLNESPFW